VDFTTAPATRLIIVRVARPASRKFDNKIAGSFWLRQVSLDPAGSAIQVSPSRQAAEAR
jgi:hypothetical protein